jgi:hypothetical protein
MRIFTLSSLLLIAIVSASNANPKLENQECKACHPKIYKEYQSSHHANASIYKDEIFQSIWEKHPAHKENNFKCAKCHTPSDHALMKDPSTLTKNEIQMSEPISCQHCHQIESVEKHAKSNKNILTKKEKTFFASDPVKKGTKLEFKEESSFLGLFTTKVGSPYHDIDYSNENYYTGNSCMGCHSHKQNSNDFTICDLEVKETEAKDTCITCHMPQVSGAVANQKVTKTHAFHSATALISKPALLSKYIVLNLKKAENGFSVTIENKANHTLVPHPLRLAKVRVSIQRAGKTIKIEPKTFVKVIGNDGKPSMPWLATEIIKDTSIKAFEMREVKFEDTLQKGDSVTVEFGYHIVNPKIAKKLELKDESLSKFVILTKKQFSI